MSETFSIQKAHEELAQLARMKAIEEGNITISIQGGDLEYPVKAIVGARVQAGFPIELDLAMDGNEQKLVDIQSLYINGKGDQAIQDLIALFEYNMHNTIEDGITSYTIIKVD